MNDNPASQGNFAACSEAKVLKFIFIIPDVFTTSASLN